MAFDLEALFADAPSGAAWYGVLGEGIAYTLSPAMHNAAMAALGLRAVYRKIDWPRADLPLFKREMDRLAGFNITKPYKQSFGDAGPGADGASLLAGAVNTAVRREDGWLFRNTDVEGLRRDLEASGFSVRNGQAVILGAGGVAPAALAALRLSPEPPARVLVFNRTRENAERMIAADGAALDLLKDAAAPVARFPVRFVETPADRRAALAESALVINATSVGQDPGGLPMVEAGWLHPGLAVYDTIYHRETELLAAARAAGARAINGLGMLVNQGALAFEIWFAEELRKNAKYTPESLRRTMREAAEKALKERQTT